MAIRLATACALAALLAAPAMAQKYPPITSRDFNIDLYQGGVLGSPRLIGMGGATTALGEGATGTLGNPAAAAMRPGATCHDVHQAVSRGFAERGYHLGHVTGHSIGMTMIEFPKVGEGVDVELRAGMVLSMHPHAIAPNGEDCLYMQDTWLVTADGGEPLAGLPMRIYAGAETRA